MPFLTELDSRAAIKGSRDPLGLVPMWSRMGRYVVGNLTTVTDSVRGFTTLLLGYHFAREVRDRDGSAADSTLNLFLKLEQIAGYSRFAARRDDAFRGYRRVARRLSEHDKVTISAETEHQILSNQKVYGLWGLFSAASRASGILEQQEAVLTPAALELVRDEYIARMSERGLRGERAILDLIRPRRVDFHPRGRHAKLAACIAEILGPRCSARERAFYRRHLLQGGEDDRTHGLQAQLVTVIDALPRDRPFDLAELRAVIKMARKRGTEWEPLADRLAQIDRLESVIAPSAYAFGFLLTRHGQRIRDVASEVRRCWGNGIRSVHVGSFGGLRAEIASALGQESGAQRWIRVAECLAAGEYDELLRALIELNAEVMKNRGGSAPWVRLENGRLDVRFQEEARDLPDRKILAGLWDSTYFINSLKAVSASLHGPSSLPTRAAA